MKIILDTHIFLWLISDSDRLSSAKRRFIGDPYNEIFLSVASFWEVIIKYQSGKLSLPQSPEIYFPEQRNQHLVKSLGIREDTIKQLIRLPMIHRDPFDRLIICQSLEHNLVLMTEDSMIAKYPKINLL
jgi:PIN domain nuclease of toxin-antitoxin system